MRWLLLTPLVAAGALVALAWWLLHGDPWTPARVVYLGEDEWAREFRRP